MTESPAVAGVLPPGLPYLRVGQGRPLVMAAAFTGDHEVPTGLGRRMLLGSLRPYAEHRQVWWVNRRQDLPAGTTMADIAADYASALRRQFPGPVDVLGTSTGGSVALQLAVDHPDVVRRLVLLAAAYRLGDSGRAVQRKVAQHLAAGRPRAAAAAMFPAIGASAPARAVLAVAGWVVGPWAFSRHGTSDCLATIAAEDAFDVGDRLPRVRVPTLVVGGDRDGYYDGGRLFAESAALLPDARLVLYQGKGHAAAISDRRVPGGVLRFLDD